MKYVILENVRSAYNVGAIFRTADGAGVSKIYLIGYTPTPVDRFGRQQPEIEKTSLGAAREMSWEHHATAKPVLDRLKTEGMQLVAVEQGAGAVSLHGFTPPDRVVYIFGNEIDGVSQATLAQADEIVEIPMLGTKESLNVSVAVGIVLYHGFFRDPLRNDRQFSQ